MAFEAPALRHVQVAIAVLEHAAARQRPQPGRQHIPRRLMADNRSATPSLHRRGKDLRRAGRNRESEVVVRQTGNPMGA